MAFSIADTIALLDLAGRLGFEAEQAQSLLFRLGEVGTPSQDATVEADVAAFRARFASTYATSGDSRIRKILATDESAKMAGAGALQRHAQRVGAPEPPPAPVASAATSQEPFPTEVAEPASREVYHVLARWMGAGYANEHGNLNPTGFQTWGDIVAAFQSATKAGWTGDWFQLLRMIALEGSPWDRASVVDPASAMRALHAIARATPENAEDVRILFRELINSRLGNLQSYSENPDLWTDTAASETILNGLRFAETFLEIIKGMPSAVAEEVAKNVPRIPAGETLLSYVEGIVKTIHANVGPEAVRVAKNSKASAEQMLTALRYKLDPAVGKTLRILREHGFVDAEGNLTANTWASADAVVRVAREQGISTETAARLLHVLNFNAPAVDSTPTNLAALLREVENAAQSGNAATAYQEFLGNASLLRNVLNGIVFDTDRPAPLETGEAERLVADFVDHIYQMRVLCNLLRGESEAVRRAVFPDENGDVDVAFEVRVGLVVNGSLRIEGKEVDPEEAGKKLKGFLEKRALTIAADEVAEAPKVSAVPRESRGSGSSGGGGVSTSPFGAQTVAISDARAVRPPPPMTFVPRTPADVGVRGERVLSRAEFRGGNVTGTPMTLREFQASFARPVVPAPAAPVRPASAVKAHAIAGLQTATAVGAEAATFGISFGATMALFGEWERFRNISTGQLLGVFGSLALFFTGFRFGMKRILTPVAERFFMGGFLFHAVPLVASMSATNLLVTGSPQLKAVAAGAPVMLIASAVLEFALNKKRAQTWLFKKMAPLFYHRSAKYIPGKYIVPPAMHLCLGGLAVLKSTAVFSATYLAQKGMQAAAVWFESRKNPILPRVLQIMELKQERVRAYDLLVEEQAACKTDTAGWSPSCVMLRDWAWIRNKEDLQSWETARLASIQKFYDPRIQALQQELNEG